MFERELIYRILRDEWIQTKEKRKKIKIRNKIFFWLKPKPLPEDVKYPKW